MKIDLFISNVEWEREREGKGRGRENKRVRESKRENLPSSQMVEMMEAGPG